MSALCAEADKALYALPTHRFGDVPARGGFLTLLSHQFLHGGWLHILFNMWFLWLAACNLEDRWGRPLFLGFYLVSGVAGALLHRAFNAGSAIPLVGASGRHRRGDGGVPGRPHDDAHPVPLSAPALPPPQGRHLRGARVRHAAALVRPRGPLRLHVAGQRDRPLGRTSGASPAAPRSRPGLRLSGLDQKLDAAVDEKASVRGDPRVAEAVQWLDSGRKAEGLQRLAAIAAAEPRNIDARLELLRVATVDNDPELRARSLVDLALCYLDQGLVEAAAGVLTELHQLSLLDRSPPDRLLRLGERFAQKGDALRSGQTLIALYRSGIRDEIGARAAVAHAAVLLKANLVGEASRVLDMVRGSPVAPADLHAKIESLSAQIAGRRVSG
jgi:hypothetical protein